MSIRVCQCPEFRASYEDKGMFSGEMYVLALLSSRFENAILKATPTCYGQCRET